MAQTSPLLIFNLVYSLLMLFCMASVRQEGVEPEKTEQEGTMEPPSVGDMEQTSNRRGSVRLNTFETMLDPSEIVNTLAKVRSRQHASYDTAAFTSDA